MFNKLLKYIKNDEYFISFNDNIIYLYNYNKLLDITDTYISITLINGKRIVIKGNNMILNKMENNEMILKGNITSIEIK